MGCFPFANSRFQMGVTVMEFVEDFGLSQLAELGWSTNLNIYKLKASVSRGN